MPPKKTNDKISYMLEETLLPIKEMLKELTTNDKRAHMLSDLEAQGGGVPPNKEVGEAWTLTSSLEAKYGARSGQVHQIRVKIWEVLSSQDGKVGEKSQFWGHI